MLMLLPFSTETRGGRVSNRFEMPAVMVKRPSANSFETYMLW